MALVMMLLLASSIVSLHLRLLLVVVLLGDHHVHHLTGHAVQLHHQLLAIQGIARVA